MLREKVFVKVNPIYDLEMAFARYNHFSFISSSLQNCNHTLQDIKNLILNEETSLYTSKTTKEHSRYKKRYGIEVVAMIPEDSNFELMCSVYHNIIKQVCAEGLLSFCFYNKKRNGHYLHVYIYEREFYPEGKQDYIYAKRTSYRDTETKKLCSKDNPNAELMYEKGQIIGEKTYFFSDKKRRIMVGTGTDLSNILNVLRNLVVATVNSFGSSFPVGYFLTKFSFKEYKGSYLHRNISLWNNAFKKIDEELENLISAGMYCDIDTRKEVDELCKKYEKFKQNNSVTYQNKYKAPIKINSDYDKISSYIDIFMRKFKEDLEKTYQKLFGVIDTSFA